MKDFAALACVALALVYLARMNSLQFTKHDFTFVAAHVISGSGCVYSAYLLYTIGFDVLSVLMPVSACMYLFRSRDLFAETITGHGALDGYDVTERWARH